MPECGKGNNLVNGPNFNFVAMTVVRHVVVYTVGTLLKYPGLVLTHSLLWYV